MTAGENLFRSGSMLIFVAAKAAVSALFVGAYALGYLAGEFLLPELPGIWHPVSRIAVATACASVLPAGLEIATPAADMKEFRFPSGIDDLLVLTTVRVLPISLVFAASILAGLLLMNIRPESNAFVVPVNCCLCWFMWDGTVDRFLSSKLKG